jgi:hypothetical protein
MNLHPRTHYKRSLGGRLPRKSITEGSDYDRA